MSTAINSRQSNEQALGRTRPLVDFPDVVPEFLYFCAENLDKHMEYHMNKVMYFKNKVLSHGVLRLPLDV